MVGWLGVEGQAPPSPRFWSKGEGGGRRKGRNWLIFKGGGRRYIHKRKDEAIHALFRSVRCEAPLFRDMSLK